MILLFSIIRFYQFLTPQKKRYTRLLFTLVILLFLSPLIQDRAGEIVMSLIFLLTNLLTLESIYLPAYAMCGLRFLASLAFLCNVINFPNYPSVSESLPVIAFCFYTLFLAGAILIISKRIMSETRVNADVLRGGICIYLLIGILWFAFYMILEYWDSNSFSYAANSELAIKDQLIYFSLTTLTTLGYGDITPVSKLATLLSNAEAVIGQLYPAIFIARLVSLYTQNGE